MLQDAGQIGRHAGHPTDGDTQLAVIDRTAPGWRPGHVEEGLFGIDRNYDGVTRGISEIAHQVVVIGFEGGEQIATETFRSLFAFEVQVEMAALALREFGFDTRLSFRLGQILPDAGVGTQFQRRVPAPTTVPRLVSG